MITITVESAEEAQAIEDAIRAGILRGVLGGKFTIRVSSPAGGGESASEPAAPEPPHRAVLAVCCTRCGAGQQELCISHAGNPTYDPHSARYATAERAGIFRPADQGAGQR